jgi:hypothetical protein
MRTFLMLKEKNLINNLNRKIFCKLILILNLYIIILIES